MENTENTENRLRVFKGEKKQPLKPLNAHKSLIFSHLLQYASPLYIHIYIYIYTYTVYSNRIVHSGKSTITLWNFKKVNMYLN